MIPNSHDALLRSENEYKDAVYKKLDSMHDEASESASRSANYANSGSYEEQEAWSAYNALAAAQEKQRAATQLRGALYSKPYFAHMETLYSDGKATETEHFFLSDNEKLEDAMPVYLKDGMGLLVPFKQDTKRPVSGALFHCYQAKDGEEVSFRTVGANEASIRPVLICDDRIENRQLIEATLLFPEAEFSTINADELLEIKLGENRNNPTLRNIISTLQKQQFQIIEADAKTSFVVQGCAGSGKSQCLIHRLFYLRDVWAKDGWDRVLLLTPTQLFRSYSAELVRRYQLSDVSNCSIAELYKNLLNTYDKRFRDRQYIIELSEEYLPDDYLHSVYQDDTITKIKDGIDSAVIRNIEAACSALGIDMVQTIDEKAITSLIEQLDAAITAFDERQAILSKDTEYEEKRGNYEKLQKDLGTKQRALERLERDRSENEEQLNKFNVLYAAALEARSELEEWTKQRGDKIAAARKALAEIEKQLDGSFSPELPGKYAYQRYLLNNMIEGGEFISDEDYLQFLKDFNADADKGISAFTNGQKPEKVKARLEKRQSELNARIQEMTKTIDEDTRRLDEFAEWLTAKAREVDGEESKIALQRSEMDRARHFLGRFESSVFEQIIWDELLPYKEESGVQAYQIDVEEDGHQRETRILYKSDLMFYIMIYAKTHPNAALADYSLFCIDEGQDLHKADYDLLHLLFPKAVFNVFGDTAQVLHTSCGISDWKKETGIDTVYTLDRNYRNTAAIVEFCNRKFDSSMDAIGRVREEDKPKILRNSTEIRGAIAEEGTVVIVKDRNAYEQFCMECGLEGYTFEFLDTKAEKPSANKKSCYSIFAAKGLEFSNVVVYAKDMTVNQKVVACTRAMERLSYYE